MPTNSQEPKLIKVSVRGMVSLGSFAQYEYYMAYAEEDGRIRLEPVSVQPVNRRQAS